MEEWKIIFESQSSGSGGGSTGNMAAPQTSTIPNPASAGSPITAGARSANQETQTPQEAQSQADFFNSALSFLKQILPFAGPLAFIIQAIRRSKIFSTFMDSFLTILSAMVDVLLIPLVPLLGPALRALLSLLPYVRQLSSWLQKLVEHPGEAIKDAFDKIGEVINKIFQTLDKLLGGDKSNNPLSKIGVIFQDFMGKSGTIWKGVADQIGGIIKGPGDFFTEKLPAIIATLFKGLIDQGKLALEEIKVAWSEAILPWIKDTFPEVTDFIKAIPKFKSDLEQIFDDFKYALKEILGFINIIEWIINPVGKGFNEISKAMDIFNKAKEKQLNSPIWEMATPNATLGINPTVKNNSLTSSNTRNNNVNVTNNVTINDANVDTQKRVMRSLEDKLALIKITGWGDN